MISRIKVLKDISFDNADTEISLEEFKTKYSYLIKQLQNMCEESPINVDLSKEEKKGLTEFQIAQVIEANKEM